MEVRHRLGPSFSELRPDVIDKASAQRLVRRLVVHAGFKGPADHDVIAARKQVAFLAIAVR